MIFASDNWAGASEAVVRAVAAAAAGPARPYGRDTLTEAVEAAFASVFEHEVAVFFVATGTAANALALAHYARPGGVVICHEASHLVADEAGAPEFFGAGTRLCGVAGPGGILAPATVAAALDRYRPDLLHSGQPSAVSISQLTEAGVAWRPAEIAAVAAVAHGKGLPLHMDGARFANAVAGTGLSPADLTWRSGVDVLSFGGTKNGCMAAEAVVFFDRGTAQGFEFTRKRAGQLFSKSRFVAAQFAAYLEDGHWLALAGHANAMAARLGAAIRAAGGRLAAEPDGNELFAVLPKVAADRLKGEGAVFYDWPTAGFDIAPLGADEVFVRLVASFATREEEVDRFAALLAA